MTTLRWCGATKVVDFCRGSSNKKTKALASRRGYGCLKDVSAAHVRALLDALVEAALLVRVTTPDKGYTLLQVSRAGLVAMQSRAAIRLAVHAPRTATKRPGSRGKSNEANKKRKEDSLSASDLPLFERLRCWRRGAAETQGVPVWVPASNAVLAAIAQRRPRTQADLCGLLPANKAGEYGADILAHVAAFTGTT